MVPYRWNVYDSENPVLHMAQVLLFPYPIGIFLYRQANERCAGKCVSEKEQTFLNEESLMQLLTESRAVEASRAWIQLGYIPMGASIGAHVNREHGTFLSVRTSDLSTFAMKHCSVRSIGGVLGCFPFEGRVLVPDV
ncbi:uncharacterized protein LY89DRAFT_277202 [Mollisia scopiformis]|uniref:Uncharacterized protein n=1 Tax=Mollisia scopiformis TaxID=149040 RepID=A0A132BBI0_MOLSC|nr:uncharacterized protein LY89DRAFT_277202 [Mollisia scopiformis]KUJ09782.1 hypothetical protein LY89DRAFT_277202 [Mollisia scopiformis]